MGMARTGWALALAAALHLRGQLRLRVQYAGIDLADQFHEGAVQRHFGAVHAGHGLGEQAADHIRRNERGAHQSLDYGNGEQLEPVLSPERAAAAICRAT